MYVDSTNNSIKFNSVLEKYDEYFSHGLGLQDIQKISFSDDIEKVYSNLLLTYMHKLESISPGSFELFIKLLSKPEKYHNHTTSVLSLSNLKNLLSTYADSITCHMAYEALNLAGLTGKVVLQQQSSHQDCDVVELNNGSYFADVFTAFQIKNSKYFDSRIVCIDGFIESVSEIHRMLEEASSSKETIILFVRGLSEEVIHTLKVNYDRGTLSIIPVITKYDLDGVNMLNDVAVVAGCDVVSSLKGQLISNIDVTLAPRVEAVTINEKGILIENRKTLNAVNQHISFLQHKLLNSDNDTSKEVFSKRIRGLGSNRVVISLKSDSNKIKRSFMIDRCLRATKISTTHGIISFNNMTYPLPSFKAAQYYQQQIVDLINNIGNIVTN